MFFQLIIAVILGFTSSSSTYGTSTHEAQNTTNNRVYSDTGGDTGQNPPPKID